MDYITDTSGDNKLIRQGDICVIYVSELQKYILKIQPNAEQQTKFGVIKASDLINHPYGVRFECKRGWILPLRLTPEYWIQLLHHRTQILYPADISMILLQLDIKPGSIIVEAGTGSGSLSHAILRACRPNGHLYTFDINESRVNSAREEFIEHGYGDHVKVTHRNICELGCGEELEGKADGCVLDLPQTWLAIEHAYKILKPNGSRLCTFSPCIEQVQQNVAKMTELKLKDIVTMECLLRPFNVQEQKLRLWTEDILEGLMDVDKKRIEEFKHKLNPTKKAKINKSDGQQESDQPDFKQQFGKSSSRADTGGDMMFLTNLQNDSKLSFSAGMLPTSSSLHSRQYNEIASHTGFLTFATKRP